MEIKKLIKTILNFTLTNDEIIESVHNKEIEQLKMEIRLQKVTISHLTNLVHIATPMIESLTSGDNLIASTARTWIARISKYK